MGLYLRGKIFWIILRHDSKKIQISTGTENRRLAERIYGKMLTELHEGRWFEGVKAKRISVSELVEKYMQSRLKSKSWNTLLRDQTLRKHILNNFGSCTLAEITTEMVADYRQMRYSEGRSIATVNRELSFLRNAYNVAIRQYKWCTKNPVADLKFDRENNLSSNYNMDYNHYFRCVYD